MCSCLWCEKWTQFIFYKLGTQFSQNFLIKMFIFTSLISYSTFMMKIKKNSAGALAMLETFGCVLWGQCANTTMFTLLIDCFTMWWGKYTFLLFLCIVFLVYFFTWIIESASLIKKAIIILIRIIINLEITLREHLVSQVLLTRTCY